MSATGTEWGVFISFLDRRAGRETRYVGVIVCLVDARVAAVLVVSAVLDTITVA